MSTRIDGTGASRADRADRSRCLHHAHPPRRGRVCIVLLPYRLGMGPVATGARRNGRAAGFFFVALPVWALAVRRAHPGAALAMLLPWVLMSLPPLMWSDAGGMLILPALGIVTVVGAIVNLVQRSMETGPPPPAPEVTRS